MAGAVLAVAAVPHSSPPAAWRLGGITLLVALAGPPVTAAWRHRSRRPAGPRTAARRRLVAEAALCAAAVAGIIVFRSQQSASRAAGINL